MNLFHRFITTRVVLIPALLTALVAGCGGGTDPILGTPGAGRVPTVSVTAPANSTPAATGVATGSTVTVTFSEAMNAASVPGSFSLACPAGTPVAASVAYDAPSRTATLTPAAPLPASTTCTATVNTTATDADGFALASPVSWTFTTVLGDTTRPTVLLTVPVAGAPSAANNTLITASFSEDMAPASFVLGSFSVFNVTVGTPVPGSVSYSAAARTVTFTPTTLPLADNTDYRATLSTGLTDVAGNALAGNQAVLPAAGSHVWLFSTTVGGDATAPTVSARSPADGSTSCLTRTVSATFSEAMNADSLNTTTFVVTNAGVAVPGSVSYDPINRVASFVPSAPTGFAPSTPFVVTLVSGVVGVRDLAGNTLAADEVWGFTTNTAPCSAGINLGSAAPFGSFGGSAGVTNSGINTVVNGNIGTTAACTLITGFHDASNVYTETPLNVGAVNGSIFCAPPTPGTASSMAIATQALADALVAYNQLAAMPAGSDPGAGQLGGLTLPPATYTSAGGTFAITTGDLVLDAQGDANAMWVFQSASALTIGLSATPRRVLLINGAQARNVYWQVGSAARIESGSTMVGTILAPAGVTISTAGQTVQTTLIGRAIGLTASVTMVNTTVVAP